MQQGEIKVVKGHLGSHSKSTSLAKWYFLSPPTHVTYYHFSLQPPPSPCVKMFPYILILNTNKAGLFEDSFFWSVGLVIPTSYCAFLSK